ncbi:hypothetical protein ACHAPT_010992 [Fusarium lateritium]
MELLHMSRDDAQTWAQSAMPSPADKITFRAAIVRTDRNGRREFPLLKRAAHEAYYPSVFEISGGKVDESDTSMRDALAREVVEETGLTVTRILNSLQPFTYKNEKQTGQELHIRIIRKVALQLSYLVEVQGDGDDFVVNPDEHSEDTWATADGLDAMPITHEMRRIELEALGASAQSQ